jgi:hypothetical protein
MVEAKLRWRVIREGDALPMLIALCVALLGTIYSTSSEAIATTNLNDASQIRGRTRLRYRSSLIADFGICTGSIRVADKDRLAYMDLDTLVHTQGQDPNQHVWLYFQTLKGEDVYLDLCMYTFNYCVVTVTEPYLPGLLSPSAPAYFHDRVLARGIPFNLHTERGRISALHSQALHRVVDSQGTLAQRNDLAEFMQAVSGQKPSRREVNLHAEFICGLNLTEEMLEPARWKSFPAEPNVNFERNPNEDDSRSASRQAARKYA